MLHRLQLVPDAVPLEGAPRRADDRTSAGLPTQQGDQRAEGHAGERLRRVRLPDLVGDRARCAVLFLPDDLHPGALLGRARRGDPGRICGPSEDIDLLSLIRFFSFRLPRFPLFRFSIAILAPHPPLPHYHYNFFVLFFRNNFC